MHHGCQVCTSKTSTKKQPRTYALAHNHREKHTNNSYPAMRSQYNFTDQTRSDADESRYLALSSIFHYRGYIWQQENLPHNKLDQQTYPWKDWMSVSEDFYCDPISVGSEESNVSNTDALVNLEDSYYINEKPLNEVLNPSFISFILQSSTSYMA